MVDFQRRDTRRGLPEDGEDSGDGDGSGDRRSNGEAEIDQVRHELEEDPEENGDGTNGETADDDRPADDDGAAENDRPADDDGAGTDDSAEDEPDGSPSDGDGDEDAGSERAGDRSDDADEHANGNGRDDQTDEQDGHHDGHDDGGHGEHDDGHDDGGHGEHDDGGHDGHDGDHDHHHHDVETLGVAVVTVSTTRTLADDPSGDDVVESMDDAGHDVVIRELIPDDYDDVQRTVDNLVGRGDVDVVVTTGGTGVTPDDETIEAVRPLFEKELPGFGELFRRRSEAEIGTRVVATRATAGVADGVPVFCLPGSRDAVRLGVEEIVAPEAPHLAGLAGRERGDDEPDADDRRDAGSTADGRRDADSGAGDRQGTDPEVDDRQGTDQEADDRQGADSGADDRRGDDSADDTADPLHLGDGEGS